MFGFGLALSFVKQKFRYFDQQGQLSEAYWKNKNFSKLNNQIDGSKLTRQADVGNISRWAGKSNFNASIVSAVSKSRQGAVGGDRMVSAE